MPVEGNSTLGYVQGTGSFTAAGTGTSVQLARRGDFNIGLSGTFVATVTLERQLPGGTNWHPLTYIDGTALSWSAPMSTVFSEPEGGALYRFNCTAFTSGTVNWRISQ